MFCLLCSFPAVICFAIMFQTPPSSPSSLGSRKSSMCSISSLNSSSDSSTKSYSPTHHHYRFRSPSQVSSVSFDSKPFNQVKCLPEFDFSYICNEKYQESGLTYVFKYKDLVSSCTETKIKIRKIIVNINSKFISFYIV